MLKDIRTEYVSGTSMQNILRDINTEYDFGTFIQNILWDINTEYVLGISIQNIIWEMGHLESCKIRQHCETPFTFLQS